MVVNLNTFMKKLLISASMIAAFTAIVSASNAEKFQLNTTSRLNMVNRNLRSNKMGDGFLLCLIMSSAGFGAYLLRNGEIKSPVVI
jgi:hypothetical protein